MQNSSIFMDELKKNADWLRQQGEDLINAIMVPPLQIVAAVINFIILLVTSRHLFEIPFSRITDVKPSIELIDNAVGEAKPPKAGKETKATRSAATKSKGGQDDSE